MGVGQGVNLTGYLDCLYILSYSLSIHSKAQKPIMKAKRRKDQIANLISKLHFYKLIPYPMDNSLSGRHRPARKTPEKDVLCFHRPAGPSTVHSPDGVSYFLPV